MINERYARNNLVDWFQQEDIQKKYIAVVGCGAIGNEVIKNLTLLGVGRIDVYDFDTIEIHNLTRSILFRESDIGKYKSDVVAQRAMELDPNIKVKSFPGEFWEKIGVEKLIQYNVIISCVDNFETRLRINQLCVLFSKNFINTGINSRHVIVETYPLSINQAAGCYECNLPADIYRNVQQRYSCGWLRNIVNEEKIIPTTAITASLAGALATSQALRIDRNYVNSNRIYVDSILGNSTSTKTEQNINCPTCGQNEPFILVKSSPKISTLLRNLPKLNEEEVFIHTSDPILINFRCIECNPKKNDVTTVFQKASNFDSSFTICKKCGQNTIQVEISDNFFFSDLMRKYRGYTLPCKFIVIITNRQKYIINLEA